MTSRITQQLKSLGRAGLDKLTASFDSWSNDVTGFGTSDDKTTYTRFMGVQLLSLQELSNIYHGDDLGARMVDVVPDEMLREGFTLELGDAGLNQAVNDKLEALGVDAHYANGIRWGRLFGEGAILIGADDGRPSSQPLVAERARDVGFLHVMDGRYYWPLTYYRDAGNPKLGQPETYGVMPPGYSGQPSAVVHETRLIRFGGAPTADQERQVNLSRDYSVLQRAYEALRAFNTGWKAVEILLTDGHQSVFKMQGLAEMIGSQGEALAAARLKVINLYRSVLRAIVVDAGDKEAGVGAEDFSRNSVSFSDIPNTLEKFMLRLAAAVQIPVTILMGQSPAGMNATGESDFRWFYDRIRSEQTRRLAPKIRRLVQVLLATKNWKAQPKALTVNFPLLWTETPQAAAQTRSAIITGDAAMVNAGIVLPEEVALQRLKPGGFAGELVLTDEGVKVRTAALGAELTALAPDDAKADIPNVELAPTDAASVIKVNEARASLNLPPLDGEDGELTLAEFKLKSAPAPGGPGFGGAPGKPAALPPKPPEGGAPPPFGKTAEVKTDGGEDQPRDDLGRFSETDGGGGSSGGGKDSGGSGGGRGEARAAKAQERLNVAKGKHEQAKAEHQAAKDRATQAVDKHEADRKARSEEVSSLAKEAEQQRAAAKAERKALEAQLRKLPQDENDLATTPEGKDLENRIGDLESHEELLAGHVSDLKREARALARPQKAAAEMRTAIESGNVLAYDKAAEKLQSADIVDLTSVRATDRYAAFREAVAKQSGAEKNYRQIESDTEDDAYRMREAREDEYNRVNADRQTIHNFPSFEREAAKVARTERAVKAHEREVKRTGAK